MTLIRVTSLELLWGNPRCLVAAKIGMAVEKEINPSTKIVVRELPRTGDDRKFLIEPITV